jgi:hypothetical protein
LLHYCSNKEKENAFDRAPSSLILMQYSSQRTDGRMGEAVPQCEAKRVASIPIPLCVSMPSLLINSHIINPHIIILTSSSSHHHPHIINSHIIILTSSVTHHINPPV